MNRRTLLRGLVAAPIVAVTAPLLPKAEPVVKYTPQKIAATFKISTELLGDFQVADRWTRGVFLHHWEEKTGWVGRYLRVGADGIMQWSKDGGVWR